MNIIQTHRCKLCADYLERHPTLSRPGITEEHLVNAKTNTWRHATANGRMLHAAALREAARRREE